MWVSVPEWMIVEGEPRLPVVGSLVRAIGIRAHGAVRPAGSATPDDVRETAATEPSDHVYALTGVAGEARDVFKSTERDGEDHRRVGAEFVLEVGADRFQVQFDGVASDLEPGSRVTVTGRLTLVGAYEWDAFGLVDTRADWVTDEVVPLRDGGVALDLSPVRG